MKTHDIAVVGGGIAGLVAAASAAREGASVVLLDGAKQLGGRARSESEDGFVRNLGPHAVYLGGGLDRALERLSVKVSGTKVSGAGSRVLDGDVLRSMPGSALSIAFTSWLGARDRAALMGAFARVALETPGAHAHASVESYLGSISAGGPRRLLRALVRVSTYGGDLEAMSAECALAQLQAALLGGVMYLDGGWQTIVDGLLARLAALDVTIRTGSKVTTLEGHGPFTLTTTSGALRARAVVVTGSPDLTAELVERDGGPLHRFAARAIRVEAACLDTRVPPARAASTGLVLGLDEPYYVQDHARYARLAPEGGGVVHAMRYDDGTDVSGRDVRAELEGITRRALGLSQDTDLDARFMPRLTVHHALVTRELGGFAGRPKATTARAGVFVAGDWVGDAGLLADASATSGSIAARHALAFAKDAPRTLHAG